jgi:hypothetical protein
MSDSEYKAQPFCSKKPERFMRRNYLRDLGYPPSGWGRYFNPAGLHTDCKSARAGIKIRLADGRMGCGWISEGLTQSETLTEAVASMNATRYSDSNVIPSFCFFFCSKRGTRYNLAPARSSRSNAIKSRSSGEKHPPAGCNKNSPRF